MGSLFAAIAVVVFAAAAAISAAAANDEADLRRIEQQRIAAMTSLDTKALEQLLADDLTYTHSGGQIQTKREFLDMLRSADLRYEKMDEDGVTVRVVGDAAVLTGTANVLVKPKDQDTRHLHIRWIDVYARRNGRWQMLAWQSTLLPDTAQK
jgi:uncharacterized protein (TIGR02246 family)